MAVLVEAISVIVRRDSIDRNYIGGWDGFIRAVPNQTMCSDGELARVGFMAPACAREFVEELEQHGLIYEENDTAVDIVVCYQGIGPTTDCEWIEFGQLPISDEVSVDAAWLFEGPRIGAGLHFKQKSFDLAVPDGRKCENSTSRSMQFFDHDDTPKDLEFLRVEDGVEVYWNKWTNKEVYIGKAYDSPPLAPRKPLN